MNTVELNHVSKELKGFSLKDLSIKVPQGYITGFIGPNGSGKSTTIHMIMDILKPDQGEIKLFDSPNTEAQLKQKIGFVYDELYMYENFTIKKMKAFIAPLYDGWDDQLFNKYLHEFDLPFRKKLKHFSKGMKMKCSLLFALAHNPEFIIMDEPTAGLDPIFRRELIDLLQELMVDEKRTIFFSTHTTTDLDHIADYIVFINKGEIVMQKSMADIQEYFHIIKGRSDMLDQDMRSLFLGVRETAQGFTALLEGDSSLFDEFKNDVIIEKATLEDIMYFKTKGSN
ncbi:ABC transporter ATP-binding protein [Aquibacillus rhizosphaerae]|uniref:ABC transporter ATP-binding protein n=1 Tax=Aquibacillus rhizosphaerae TaxID=3051431 RepID=A0ABT7L5G4_9BACI|nr:ABC transporter ATP-binding protein [Aquibacillus sp. LR5S19]MDL4841095.1 ABC transporter ATP-binding protein [Aquibacillus sp. LR5S19]